MYAKSKSRPKILYFCLKVGECPLTPLIQLNVGRNGIDTKKVLYQKSLNQNTVILPGRLLFFHSVDYPSIPRQSLGSSRCAGLWLGRTGRTAAPVLLRGKRRQPDENFVLPTGSRIHLRKIPGKCLYCAHNHNGFRSIRGKNAHQYVFFFKRIFWT